jgi:tetratricopeptide (TPR) repeat protein
MPGQEPTSSSISGGIFYGPVLQGRDIQATFHLPAAAPTALAQLPPAVTGFTGRDGELAVLAGLLAPATTTAPVLVSAVAGLAGVGKTTLAIEAGHVAVQRGWFSGGVLFLDLHGYDEAPVEPAQALDALLRALAVPAEHIPPTVDERAALYRSVLAQLPRPVLVVVDNASSEAQVKPLLPGMTRHKVLVTSRNTLAGLDARLIDVTVLTDENSMQLLDAALRVARPDDDRITRDHESSARLAKLCGGLPLALQITAALLKADPGFSTAELAGQLADERRRLQALQYEHGGTPGPLSVAAAFELSYIRLDEAAARVFRLLSVNSGPDVSTAAAADLVDLPMREVRTVLAMLARAHLLEAASGGVRRWRMHDLVRLYARQKSDHHAGTDAPELARERLFRYYLNKASAANKHLLALPGQAVPGDFTGRADALKWLDVEWPNLLATVSVAARTGPIQVACDLPVTLGQYFYLRRRLDEWLVALAISRTVASQMAERDKQARSLIQLGWALAERRRFDEAIAACDEAAKILEVNDQFGRAGALTNRGHALRGQDRFQEAIEAYQEAAEGYRKTGDERGLGIVLTSLGVARARLGKPGPAVEAHREAVAIFRAIGDRHEEGAALTNLGRVLRDRGEQDEAIRVCGEAVTAYRDTEDRHGEGTALDELGLALQQAGRADEAATNHETARKIFQTLADRHGQGIALSNASSASMKLRRFEEAVTAGQAAVALFQGAADSYNEGIALGRLGLALQELRRFDEAIAAHQANLEICRKTNDQRGQAEVLDNLGMALQGAQRFDDAIGAYQDAAAIYREIGDQDAERSALRGLEAAEAAQLA